MNVLLKFVLNLVEIRVNINNRNCIFTGFMQSSNDQPKPRSSFAFGVMAVILMLIALSSGYLIGHQATPLTASMTSTEMTSTSMAEQPVSGLSRPNTIPLVEGWYRGSNISYLDYGQNPNVAVPILAFFWANGTAVVGQRNVIDTIPGQPGYSDFWRVYKVTVPISYAPNSIRSFEEAMASGYSIQLTDIVVNCPVVNPNSTIQGASVKSVEGWYRGRDVYYFDHGGRSPSVGFVVRTAPIYTFVWENGTAVADQRNVIDVRPGDMGYSDLWNVTKVVVKQGYIANTLNDVTTIMAQAVAGTVTVESANIFVNCPVVPST